MSLAKLQNTTIMSSELSHARLKHLAAKIGVTEDIVSRLALGVSIREGKIPNDWQPKKKEKENLHCLLYTSPSPRDLYRSRMPSSA